MAVTAEFLVSSINGLADTGKISKEFIGLVLLPIVGNAAGLLSLMSFSMLPDFSFSRALHGDYGEYQRQVCFGRQCRCWLKYCASFSICAFASTDYGPL